MLEHEDMCEAWAAIQGKMAGLLPTASTYFTHITVEDLHTLKKRVWGPSANFLGDPMIKKIYWALEMHERYGEIENDGD